MKHFSIADWTDYVRHVATEEQAAQIQAHLDEGCSGCMEALQTWTSVKEYASREGSYEPPPGSLRVATSYFAAFKLSSNPAPATRIARLSFDSFARGLQIGVRGSDSSPRQLMYEYDDLYIDLRLEEKPASNEVLLVGQVADSVQALGSMEDLPVSLMSGNNVLQRTTANQSGEFQFSFRRSKHLQLSVGMAETAILLSLPEAEA